MRVDLIAQTVVTGWGAMRDAGWEDHPYDEKLDAELRIDNTEVDADWLSEFSGRLCYQSWSRPNPATATNEGYLGHILEVEHESVLEHSSATFLVREVSRSLLMELRTHRHLSFSALSQRYVNESDAIVIIPPALEPDALESIDAASRVGAHMRHSLIAYASLIDILEEANKGREQPLSRKEIREAARCVLPNATATQFVVTGNMRAWRNVIHRRIALGADAEMRRLARAILDHLKTVAPNIFQDM